VNQRPFRFGVVAARATSGKEWTDLARQVEALGYSTLLTPDRLGSVLSPLPALAAASSATRTLRVGTFVIANGLRNPALLAWDCATLDFLSNGRFELGLGTGVAEADFRRAGIPFDRPGARIDRLAATIQSVKAFFDGSGESRGGGPESAYRAQDYPRPAQTPRPPILIAGAGPRLLALAAREADILAFGVGARASEADLAEKIALVRQEAGRRFTSLELSLNLLLVGEADPAPSVRARVKAIHGADLDELIKSGSPLIVTGSTDAMCAQLLNRRERLGVSYVTIAADQLVAFAPVVERLAGR